MPDSVYNQPFVFVKLLVWIFKKLKLILIERQIVIASMEHGRRVWACKEMRPLRAEINTVAESIPFTSSGSKLGQI